MTNSSNLALTIILAQKFQWTIESPYQKKFVGRTLLVFWKNDGVEKKSTSFKFRSSLPVLTVTKSVAIVLWFFWVILRASYKLWLHALNRCTREEVDNSMLYDKWQ